MIRIPDLAEWDISALSADRRDYLDANVCFEDISSQAVSRAQIASGNIEPYNKPAPEDPKEARKARQAIFVVKMMDIKACDLLYNAPDGLRGRYWQTPDHGFLATKFLIAKLLPRLLAFAEQNPLIALKKATPMALNEVQASLELPSAKVWPAEPLEEWTNDGPAVRRWADYEQDGPSKTLWRRSPTSDRIEVKGGLLGLDGTEYVPKCKRDRSYQIHQFGFT